MCSSVEIFILEVDFKTKQMGETISLLYIIYIYNITIEVPIFLSYSPKMLTYKGIQLTIIITYLAPLFII